MVKYQLANLIPAISPGFQDLDEGRWQRSFLDFLSLDKPYNSPQTSLVFLGTTVQKPSLAPYWVLTLNFHLACFESSQSTLKEHRQQYTRRNIPAVSGRSKDPASNSVDAV